MPEPDPPGLVLTRLERQENVPGQERLRLLTAAGVIEGRLHPAASRDAAVLWVFGAGGDLGGPAGGLYTRLGRRLRPRGITSLELAYRHPGHLGPCVQDVLLGLAWHAGEGRRRVVLVGHSFGGALVITARAASETAIAVAALSSQTRGTEAVTSVAPRPLLVVHGLDDEVLPAASGQEIHRRARPPKELILYPDCRHGLDGCREPLDRDLLGWLERVLALGPRPEPHEREGG
jgi:fermentation-respiration switch protein FrsA (DUF1100 family)